MIKPSGEDSKGKQEPTVCADAAVFFPRQPAPREGHCPVPVRAESCTCNHRTSSALNPALLEQGIATLFQALHELSQHMAQLAVKAGATAPPAPSPEMPVCNPKPFAGDSRECWGFLFQCRMILSQRPRACQTERAWVKYVVGWLQGRALNWAQALHANGTLETLTAEEFLQCFKQVFDRLDYTSSAADRLFTIQQGDRSVAEYNVEFYLLAEEAVWNDPAIVHAFQRGLNHFVRDDSFVTSAHPANLQALVDRAV